jgi:nicotinamide mononucleotide transporter PnuC
MANFTQYITLDNINLIFGFLYVYYLTKAKPIAWVWGIIFCAIVCYSSIIAGLYLLGVLNIIFVILAFLGLYNFKKGASNNQSTTIIELSLKKHLIYALYVGLFFIIVYFGEQVIINFLNNNLHYAISNTFRFPFLEIPIFAFSIIATYMQTKAVRSSWAYYVVINAFNIIIYYYAGIPSYSVIYAIFGLLSVSGFYKWNKLYHARS